jgi:hypothetical protein
MRRIAPFVLIAMLGAAVACMLQIGNGESELHEATSEAEIVLTETYGQEVQEAIERFQSEVGAFETERDPSILLDLATGPLLESLQAVRVPLADEPAWHVISSADVEGVHVLEYDPDRFRAIGCGVIERDKVNSAGRILESLPAQDFRTMYVFVREDGIWKAAAFLNFIDRSTFYRDWDYIPEWEKEILGNVPDYLYQDCTMDF